MAEPVDRVKEGLKELEEALAGYEKAKAYDDSSLGEFTFLSSRLAGTLKRSSLEDVPNYASTVIDAVSDRLEIAALTTTGPQDLLDNIWEDNNLGLDMPDFIRQSLVYGDGYVAIWPRTDEEGAIIEPVQELDVIFLPPTEARVVYEVHRPNYVKYAIRKRWDPERKVNQVTVFIPEDREGPDALIQEWESASPRNLDTYQLVSEAVNPYGGIPLFHLRTRAPHGVPEHKKAFGPQNSIAKLVIYQMVTVEFQGFPQRYALSEISAALGLLEDGETDIYGQGPSPDNLSQDAPRTKLTADPGSIWWMPRDIKEVGQFATADPGVFLEPAREHIRMMGDVTSTPIEVLNSASGQERSGTAISMRHVPLDRKVSKRKARFGSALEEGFSYALGILGQDGAEVTIDWRDMDPKTEALDTWTVVDAKIKAGVPRERALMEAGYTQEDAAQMVQEWQDQQEEAQARAMDIAAARGSNTNQPPNREDDEDGD